MREVWECFICGNEIEFILKENYKELPISSRCTCGGKWKFIKEIEAK